MGTMNIRCKPGHKVIVTKSSSENGTSFDAKLVKDYLKIGDIYTVAAIDVGGWHTSVTLEEVPNIEFNSVSFVDYDEDYKEPLRWEVEMVVTSKVKVIVEADTLDNAKGEANALVKEFPMVLDMENPEIKEIVSVKQIESEELRTYTIF